MKYTYLHLIISKIPISFYVLSTPQGIESKSITFPRFSCSGSGRGLHTTGESIVRFGRWQVG